MKSLLLFLAVAGLALAEDKKPIPIPEPEIFKLQYLDANARLLVMQYNQMREDFEKKFQLNSKEIDVVLADIFKKTGLDRAKYSIDVQNKSLVEKPAEVKATTPAVK